MGVGTGVSVRVGESARFGMGLGLVAARGNRAGVRFLVAARSVPSVPVAPRTWVRRRRTAHGTARRTAHGRHTAHRRHTASVGPKDGAGLPAPRTRGRARAARWLLGSGVVRQALRRTPARSGGPPVRRPASLALGPTPAPQQRAARCQAAAGALGGAGGS